MAKKVTIVENFAKVEGILREQGYEELADFIAGRSEQTAKKNTNRKPTATQVENAKLGKAIVEYLSANGKTMQIKDMIKNIPECADLTINKVSAVANGMVDNGLVKSVVKGVSFFSAAE